MAFFFFFFFLPIVFGLTIALEQLIIFDKNNSVEKEPLFSSSATKVLFIESFKASLRLMNWTYSKIFIREQTNQKFLLNRTIVEWIGAILIYLLWNKQTKYFY